VQARVTVTVVSVSKAWTGLWRELANLDCSAQLLQCSRAQHSCCRYIDSLQLVACTTKTTSLIAHTQDRRFIYGREFAALNAQRVSAGHLQ